MTSICRRPIATPSPGSCSGYPDVPVAEREILRIFEAHRPQLMGLAYRMSGSVSLARSKARSRWIAAAFSSQNAAMFTPSLAL